MGGHRGLASSAADFRTAQRPLNQRNSHKMRLERLPAVPGEHTGKDMAVHIAACNYGSDAAAIA